MVDNLISRNAAIECVVKMIHEYREQGEDDLADGMILALRYGIKCLPPIDAALVVHGHWMLNEDGDIECSECYGLLPVSRIKDLQGHTFSVKQHVRYCPNCGARMDGEWIVNAKDD